MSENRSVPPPQLHFDDGSRIMNEQHSAGTPSNTAITSPRGSVSIQDYYEVDRLSREIQATSIAVNDDSGFSCRVALQFPDELLCDAPEVCWLFQEKLGERALVFVLGDSTFGPCCPDEVSALHLNASILIHFGHACLSPAASLPVLYSFGITDFDVVECVNAIQKQQQQEETDILLLYEVKYQHAMVEVERGLRERCGVNVRVGEIPQPSCSMHNETGENEATISPETNSSINHKKFVVGGLELPTNVDLSSYTLLFIGDGSSKSRQYVNIMLRFLSMSSSPSQYWTYSPSSGELETSLPPFLQRQLNRRFYLTQKARDANVFGILVGTMSQRHFQSVVSTLQKVIKDAGKSCYTFAVGKINAAKLANFGEVECFVLVACGENSLLDNERDLHVPVITPLELDIALGNVEWGSYSLDYNDFLARQQQEAKPLSTNDEDDNDAPYFSLVSGTYVDAKAPSESIDLSVLPGKGQLAAYKSEASNYLKKREYQGLETNFGKDEAHAAVPGQTGIASDYGNR